MEKLNRKAIALLSGGLDSILAAKIIKDQGIEIIGLHLISPFGCHEEVEKAAVWLGITLIKRDKGEAYLDLVKNPKYGIGRSVNPCIDCRIYMFEIAEIVRAEIGADFIITGEVLGQRPMSQQRHSMGIIDRKSGTEDKVLRPLSAHLFPPTLAEREGWVNREKLYAISGRSRKDQMAMVETYGVSTYTPPGGGCLLTEMAFGPKLRDFHSHETFANPAERMAQSELLRYGRHFRPTPKVKFMVARDAKENAIFEEKWRGVNGTFFFPISFVGPNAIALGELSEEDRKTIGEILVRYGKGKDGPGEIGYESVESQGRYRVEKAINEEMLGALRL